MSFKKLKDGWLSVGDGHEIYYSEYGDRDGVPIVSVHGGPGSRSKKKYLEVMPERTRVVLFDQRGCGESRPSGEIENNTTDDLIEDMERLREELGIDKWVVVGGSWGATLSLLYAERYPDKVLGLGLKSVFLGREDGVSWLYSGGVKLFCPDYWDRFKRWCDGVGIDVSEFVDYGLKVLESGSDDEKDGVVRAIYDFEVAVMNFDKPVVGAVDMDVSEDGWNSVKIYLHYVKNGFFIDNDQVLRDIDKIGDIPVGIVHGRYDLTCPPEQAWVLSEKLRNGRLWFTNYAGHHLGYDGKMILKQWLEYLISTV